MFTIPGTNLKIPATVVPKRTTSYQNAWDSGYTTVRLDHDFQAIRVHMGATDTATTDARMAKAAGSSGRWFSIGDVVLTRSEYRDRYALPDGFTHIDTVALRAGAIMNVGRAAGLFAQQGGGEQAEWLAGPEPVRTTLSSAWVDYEGNA